MQEVVAIDTDIRSARNAVVMEIPQCAEKTTSTPTPNIERSHYRPGNAVTVRIPHSIEELGWTPEEALETYLRLRTFAEDWDAPGMEAYDNISVAIKRVDPAGQTMGLRTDSVVVTDNLATVLNREIDKTIGHCRLMHQVDQALKPTVGLNRG